MFTHRSNSFFFLALLILVVLQLAKSQSDVYQQYQQKRNGALHYCGKLLSHALQLVCNGRYNKPPLKKSGQEIEEYPWNYDDSYPFRSRASANAMMGRFGGDGPMRRESRGVHDECCVKPCSRDELLSYCAN